MCRSLSTDDILLHECVPVKMHLPTNIVARMCTREDALAFKSGAPCIDGIMSYNLLITLVFFVHQRFTWTGLKLGIFAVFAESIGVKFLIPITPAAEDGDDLEMDSTENGGVMASEDRFKARMACWTEGRF